MREDRFDYHLLKGSQEHPAKFGGACLNEMAVVAAGLAYRSIRKPRDCPPCFSRPIAALSIAANDVMPDEEREALKPFVLRLAGAADVEAIEIERAQFIALALLKTIAPIALRYEGKFQSAAACEDSTTMCETREAVEDAWGTRTAFANLVDAAAPPEILNDLDVADVIAIVVDIVGQTVARAEIWPRLVRILDDVLRIGRRADLDPNVALERIFKSLRDADAYKSDAASAAEASERQRSASPGDTAR